MEERSQVDVPSRLKVGFCPDIPGGSGAPNPLTRCVVFALRWSGSPDPRQARAGRWPPAGRVLGRRWPSGGWPRGLACRPLAARACARTHGLVEVTEVTEVTETTVC